MGLWPVCFLIVLTLFFGRDKGSVCAINTLGDERNVGTVLFDRSSVSNHCWTNEEFVMLSSRKMFQDLLPKVETLNIQTDQNIADLLNYFQICLEYVCEKSVGKTKRLMAVSQERSALRKRRLARLKYKRFAARGHNNNDSKGESNSNYSQKSFGIFLPFLDDEIKPNSIALPFKDHNLWSLYEEESVAILSTYYETCVNCLFSKENHQKILADFNRDFYKWLLRSVYPRLNDDKLYPAFGGVLKIIAFLKNGVENEEMNSISTSTSITSKPIEVIMTTTKSSKGPEDTDGSIGMTEIIVIAVSSAALLSLLVGLSLVCYRYLRKHSDECSPYESPRSDVALLYKNEDFCDLDTCLSIASRKSIGEKVKDWWRQRFKTCPGGCDRTLETERYLAAFEYKSKDSLGSNRSRRPYKRRSKKVKSVSVSVSPSSSPCGHHESKKFFYSTDISSSESDSSYR
ncbi:hypothetical protein TSAR_016677 [Trichomalopsis sarcophagae]|uniref:Uncharacterized protein n=1 Tax=Trichomalopsis sarcophagae TaxID=543379 RepID=A0A232FJG0_9HYME|nr:hypothetical protein TSAR_016677 [Trichomalopsis sarcophagae]